MENFNEQLKMRHRRYDTEVSVAKLSPDKKTKDFDPKIVINFSQLSKK
jgi:hypothetical protein